ncbi:cytidylate kinase family protein [Piscinibacter sakaiensis]|uniref:cytidylate kinase family protein n=1 Tax=Piscinibacter sakaiensis TaxID=1547922 RepID=UPI003AAE055A
MPVIAFTQEMGSLAKDVAVKLAEEMKLDIARHEVIDNVASRMHVPKSLVSRLREGKAGTIERMRADRDAMAIFTAEEVLEVAERGNVVLRGWGSTCLLRPISHVVTVRITRPFEQRVEWLMKHLDTDDRDAAREEIERSDSAHAARMHELFGVSWGDPLLYDIVLNTDRLSVDACVQVIRELASRPEFAETAESRQQIANLTLEAQIRSALRADDRTEEVRVTITADQGKVVLSGIVLDDAQSKLTAEVAAGVAGVSKVDNQLRLMSKFRRFTHSKT